MTSIGSIAGLTPAIAGAAHSNTNCSKLAHAAGQFEALLLGEMLKSAASDGWMGGSEDQSGSSLSEMAQEQFAQALADSGGLGIARMITAEVRPDAKPSTPVSTRDTPASR